MSLVETAKTNKGDSATLSATMSTTLSAAMSATLTLEQILAEHPVGKIIRPVAAEAGIELGPGWQFRISKILSELVEKGRSYKKADEKIDGKTYEKSDGKSDGRTYGKSDADINADIKAGGIAKRIDFKKDSSRYMRYVQITSALNYLQPNQLLIIGDDSYHPKRIFFYTSGTQITSDQNYLKTGPTLNLINIRIAEDAERNQAEPIVLLEKALASTFLKQQTIGYQFVGYDWNRTDSTTINVTRLADCIRGAELYANSSFAQPVRQYAHAKYGGREAIFVHVPSISGSAASTENSRGWTIRLSSLPVVHKDTGDMTKAYSAWLNLDASHECAKVQYANAMRRYSSGSTNPRTTRTNPEKLFCFHTVAAYHRAVANSNSEKPNVENQKSESPKEAIIFNPFAVPSEALHSHYQKLRTQVIHEIRDEHGKRHYVPLNLTDIEVLLWAKVGNEVATHMKDFMQRLFLPQNDSSFVKYMKRI